MNFGNWNYWFGRVMAQGNRFYQPFSLALLLWIATESLLLVFCGLLVVTIGAVVWVIIDSRKVLEDELGYLYGKIPQVRKILENQERMLDKLGK